jgi:2-dehydro-3-deoxyphosphogluconate aldolase / (4S)-4-hydroxy-2-oxoglutarate aldolase
MKPPFPAELQKAIEARGIVAVLVIDEVKHAVPVARALMKGGVTAMELTLRTPAALDCIRAIRQQVPEMLAGVGTVIQPKQVAEVVSAGAAFGVAPGFNRRVMEAAISAGLPFAPGVATATDIEAALELDCRLMKFFPAEPSGGLTYLASVAAPYAHLKIRYIPLGGLNSKNMRSYLESPLVGALGGSWLAPRELIAAEQWDHIEANARAAVEAVASVRNAAPAATAKP